MDECSRFEELLAGDPVTGEEERWMAEHARVCPACASLAAAYRVCERVWAREYYPPPEFAAGVVAMLRAERLARKHASWKAFTPMASFLTAVGFAGAAALAAAVLVTVGREPDAASWIVEVLSGELILPAADFHVIMGGVVGVAATLGTMAYYYLIPRIR